MKKTGVIIAFSIILLLSFSLVSASWFSTSDNLFEKLFGKITGKIIIKNSNKGEISQNEPSITINELSKDEKNANEIVRNLKKLRANLKSERKKLETEKGSAQIQNIVESEKTLENYMVKNNIPLEILKQLDEIDAQAGTWTGDFNLILIMSDEEKKKLLGLTFSDEEKKKLKEGAKIVSYASKENSEYNLPDFFDWRNYSGKNYVTPVKDQGSCGSCWAFGAVASLEGTARAYYNNPDLNIDLSEQDLVSCFLPNVFGSAGCGGAYTDQIAYLFSDYWNNIGQANEDCFPYTASNVPCSQKCSDWESDSWKDNGLISVDLSSDNLDDRINAIKRSIISNGPVEVGMAVYSDFISYQNGIYRHTGGGLLGYHAITIVGFGESDEETYWVVKNSWGTDWGEGGYFRIFAGDSEIDQWFGFTAVEPYLAQGSIQKLCNDNDNDNYCNWGIGSKPDNCPTSCSSNLIEDCDDSNPSLFYNCGISTEIKGWVSISSDPSEAKVYVESLDTGIYRYLGKTPLQKRLNVGLREFKIEKENYMPTEFNISIIENEINRTNISLDSLAKISSPDANFYRIGDLIKINGTTPRFNFINYTILLDGSYSSKITLTNYGRSPILNSELGVLNTSGVFPFSSGNSLTLIVNTNEKVYESSASIYLDQNLKWSTRFNLFCGRYCELSSKMTVGDINNDNYKEVILTRAGEPPRIYAFDSKGDTLWSFDFGPSTDYPAEAPLSFVTDLNNDGNNEIIVFYSGRGSSSAQGIFYIFNSYGELINSKEYGSLLSSGVFIADLNNDGSKEIVVQNKYYIPSHNIFIINSSLDIISSWQFRDSWTDPTSFIQSGDNPAMGNFDSDSDFEIAATRGTTSIVFPTGDWHDGWCWNSSGGLYVYNIDGSIVNGWPFNLHVNSISNPVVGDINNDGEQEIVVSASNYGNPDCNLNSNESVGLYAFYRNGSIVAGFPVLRGMIGLSSPALGDINNDRLLEIGVSVGSNFYFLSSSGNVLEGWPKSGWPLNGDSPIISILDNNNSIRIVHTYASTGISPIAGIRTYDSNGNFIQSLFERMPWINNYDGFSSPRPIILEDIDNDNRLDLIAISPSDWNQQNLQVGSVLVWEFEGNYNREKMPWPQFMHDAQRTGCYDCDKEKICTDSDNGINFNVKGIVSYNKKSYADLCLADGKTLIEYSCSSDEKPLLTNYTCPGKCFNGKCVDYPSIECVDTDGENLYVKGSVIFGKKIYTDKCSGTTKLKEQFCVDGERQEEIALGLCYSGRLIKENPTENCTDYDNGDIYTEGVAFFNNKPKIDACINAKTLKEYICKKNNQGKLKLYSQKVDCPLGCGEGRCVKKIQ